MTSSEDHFRAAEKFLEEAESNHEPDTWAEWCREPAKMRLAVLQKMFAWATISASPQGKHDRLRH